MPAVSEILNRLSLELRPDAFADDCVNGLQVPGPDEVTTVVFALDAASEVLEQVPEGSLLIAHHGVIWGQIRHVDAELHRRLSIIYRRNLAVVGMHLPLDSHPEFGTAEMVAQAIGLEQRAGFGDFRGQTIGRCGEFPEPLAAEVVLERLRTGLRAPLAQLLAHKPGPYRRAAIVTGAGASFLGEAIEGGFDLFITGEGRYSLYFRSRETPIAVAWAGHYATEIVGMVGLKSAVESWFPGLRTILIETPNPL